MSQDTGHRTIIEIDSVCSINDKWARDLVSDIIILELLRVATYYYSSGWSHTAGAGVHIVGSSRLPSAYICAKLLTKPMTK